MNGDLVSNKMILKGFINRDLFNFEELNNVHKECRSIIILIICLFS